MPDDALAQFSDEQLAAGHALFERPWQFLLSAPRLDVLPPADRPEIAFAGRSNVGKSSLLNALVRRHGLARTSNTPGRTQELNFFTAEGAGCYLVDLPGYGYAKAPKDKVGAWTKLVRDYLRGRASLKRVFVLVDARHGLMSADLSILELLDEAAVSYMLVLTKLDKLSIPAQAKAREALTAALASHAAAYPAIAATSSVDGTGLEDLRAAVAMAMA
jgi:GTP-binding protein